MELTQRHSIAPGKKPPTQPGAKPHKVGGLGGVPAEAVYLRQVGWAFLKVKGATKSPAVGPGSLDSDKI